MEQDEIIKLLERGIYITKEPFSEMGVTLGLTQTELINRIKSLKDNKIIRQISPIYDSKMLGYEVALVAFRTTSDTIDSAAKIINTYPGVSHNYERSEFFNLWFTIAVDSSVFNGLDKTVQKLAELCGVTDYAILAPVKRFKINVMLGSYWEAGDREEVQVNKNVFIPLTNEEKQIVRVTQIDMPLVGKPFLHFAEILGLDEDYLLDKLREFQKRGIIRRIAAVMFHRKMGYSANAMVVWRVPQERIAEVGSSIASFKAVSHCYERTTTHQWLYNLYGVIHGKSVGDVEAVVEKINNMNSLNDYKVLFSIKEFKKVRPKYFTEDYIAWEMSNSN
ncbi:MAG: Lrp/AsnC family transcriptional regulator [Nitrospirae bacterium YQR-1]